ncbi:MAG: proline--tRNA ligase [Clostridia bacterium]|nr:proline--tRNA ligase [Clostridia bacterium]
MNIQHLSGERFKEKPSDANIISQIYLLRGGYIKYVANGIYSLLMPAKRIINKIENIVRSEMDKIGGQEVLMPVVLPKELWEESERYQTVGRELLRLKDRGGKEMLLAMTHEEAAVALVRDDAISHNKYPFMIYQLQTKFRDEPRCKGGLIRVREFTMKDAYSFHTTQEDMCAFYNICKDAYFNIFNKIGLNAIAVGSDTGMMGGSVAHEFMLLSDAGEDNIAICDTCGYMDNVEVANTKISNISLQDANKELIHTPSTTDIESLSKLTGFSADRIIKAAIFGVEGEKKPCIVFIRGDYEVNEQKLKKVLGKNVYPFESDIEQLKMGFIGPCDIDNNIFSALLFDESLSDCKNMLCGANKADYHIKGVSCGRDFEIIKYYNLYQVKDGDICLKCQSKLKIKKGIEIDNIFQLGKKYTQSMNMFYTDENGQRKNPFMGCYGIGIGRAMASVIEQHHDEYGPVWPFAIAPWHIHICVLNGSEEMRNFAANIYENLKKSGYEVIIDDRKVSAGVQFSDADLLGIPYRIIIGNKGFVSGETEIISRDKSFKKIVKCDDLLNEIKAIIEKEKAKL